MTIPSVGTVKFDPDIIPDPKIRALKESFELFRRACNLHDSINTLEIAKIGKAEKLKKLYQLTILHLEEERNKLVKEAIKKYGIQ